MKIIVHIGRNTHGEKLQKSADLLNLGVICAKIHLILRIP